MSGSRYLYFGGASLPPAPYTCGGTRFVTHVFLGDQAAQQAFIDGTLNAASSAGRFKALSRFVFLIAVACARIGSSVPPYSVRGTMAETDVGFWIAVLDTHQGNALLMQPAYMFVDNWLALCGGREIWGFPKALGVMSVGAGGLQDAPITVSSLAIRRFGPSAAASLQQIFEVLPPAAAPGAHAAAGGGAANLIAALTRAVDVSIEGSELLLNLLRQYATPGVIAMVMLKQVRGPGAGAGTVYSAIVRSDAKTTTMRDLGMVAGGYQLTLADFDTQPIARDLGLAVGPQSSIIGVWGDLDFTLDLQGI